MRVILTTALLLASLVIPANAQGGRDKSLLDLQYEVKERERAENEKAYNEMMRRTRESSPAAKADPWRTIRPAESKTKR
jgi:hypothetical protein